MTPPADANDIHDHLARQDTRITILEAGQEAIRVTLSQMQSEGASARVEAAASRGEQRQATADLAGKVETLVRQGDVARGAEMEREKWSKTDEKRVARWDVWMGRLFPFAIAGALWAFVEFIQNVRAG